MSGKGPICFVLKKESIDFKNEGGRLGTEKAVVVNENGRKEKKSETRSSHGEDGGVQRAGIRKVGIKIEEEKTKVVSKEVETQNIEGVRTESTTEVGTEKKLKRWEEG